MEAARNLPKYTYSDYAQWVGDWEMIDGIPYAMSPSPTQKHQRISLAIASEILIAIRKQKDECGDCVVQQDVDWILNDDTIFRPDLSIVCGKSEDYIRSAPQLIIEILSPSSGYHDRIVKYEVYQAQGVFYYIIVDPLSNSYVSYALRDGKYEEYNSNEFLIHGQCSIEIDIADILRDI
ncbi:MAG: Uma2 family endonuclease [Bacteroidetes bacterium]|nr:Uma2 family endonuclease [Bacteroidota bacterium]